MTVVAVLWLADSLAAQEAAPPDRLEQLEKLRKEFAPVDPNRQYGEKDRITISGVVATADGTPLPERLTLGGMTRRPTYSSGFTVALDQDGRFAHQVEFGRVFLYISAPGYAPAFAGPLEAEAGGKIENVRLSLDRGFTGKIRVVDEQGQPLAGARLETTHLYGEESNGVQLASRPTTTDDQGVAELDHSTEYPLIVETRVAGFQYDRSVLKLRREEPVEWRLKKARPTTGTIVSAESGEPLAGAEVSLIQRQGFHSRVHPPYNEYSKPPILATTDKEGRFTLDTLRDDCQYMLLATAPGRGGQFVADVQPGQANLAIKLGPPRFIRGKVIGDLSRLEQRLVNGRRTPSLRALTLLRLVGTQYSLPIYAPIESREGVGYFEFTGLFPGTVRIEAPGQSKSLELTDSIDDLVINLESPESKPQPAAAPRRMVVLKLKIPAGEPAPRGELLVRVIPTRPSGNFETKTLPVGDGALEFDVPVPCRLQWETDNLIGYWIKEESLELAEAPDPLVKEIEALPAGAVYGQVRETDGSPCREFMYTIISVSPAPEVKQTYFGINTSGAVRDAYGRFTVGPLPLGGVYRVEISGMGDRANTRVASEDLRLTREASAPQVELRLPRGITLAGQVLDAEDKPVHGIQVRLGYRSGNHSHEGLPVVTDDEGRFRLPRINPDLGGLYYLHVPPQETWRGQQLAIKPREEPLTVQLQRGWSLEGVLLEHRTGKVIPGATVYARPAQYDRAFYLGSHEARTDAAGRFRFDTLEPFRYRFFTNGVNASQVAPPWEADPRSDGPIVLSGDIYQGAGLTPVPPPPEP